jgi:hypothetical protein
MHLLATRTGLREQIDVNLHLLKKHLPYDESDHVLNIAYNIHPQWQYLPGRYRVMAQRRDLPQRPRSIVDPGSHHGG